VHDPRSIQEQHIEPGYVVPNQRAVPDERLQLTRHGLQGRRRRHRLLADPRQVLDDMRYGTPWVDKRLKAVANTALIEPDRSDLDDCIVLGVETGRLQVDRYVLLAAQIAASVSPTRQPRRWGNVATRAVRRERE
jgi:hypothetical protein